MSTSEDKWVAGEEEEGCLLTKPTPALPGPDLRIRITERRDELQKLLDMHKQEFARMEIGLVELRRSMDALHGGIEELNRLLAADYDLLT